MFDRWYASPLSEKLSRPFVHVMFGARQTGKSTLLDSLLPPDTFRVDLANPETRARHLANPGEFVSACAALPSDRPGRFVLVDEVQTVPTIFDAVQHLYDNDKTRWRFVLCGSSAHKLRRIGANLLPGRSFLHHLHPLTLVEHPARIARSAGGPLSLAWPGGGAPASLFPAWDIDPRLAYGALPGIVTADERDRAELLRAYVVIHLEEETRREAVIKDWGAFLRFIQFAAVESGGILNYAAVAREAGVSLPTVKAYYQLLEDMFVGFHVPAFRRSPRKNLLSTPKFFFFDLGVRNAAAGLRPSVDVVRADPGRLFEQWVGGELYRRIQYLGVGALHYLRTRDGTEVDFIVEREGALTPVEVKWTERPTEHDARHVRTFLDEHPRDAARGYVVCRCPEPLALHDKVTALPWWCL